MCQINFWIGCAHNALVYQCLYRSMENYLYRLYAHSIQKHEHNYPTTNKQTNTHSAIISVKAFVSNRIIYSLCANNTQFKKYSTNIAILNTALVFRTYIFFLYQLSVDCLISFITPSRFNFTANLSQHSFN